MLGHFSGTQRWHRLELARDTMFRDGFVIILSMVETTLWHGTGRYKYDNGEVVDILRGIIKKGGLVPNKDDWDMKRGLSQTISFARDHSYARLYASLFLPPKDRTFRELVRRLVLSARFFLPSKWVAYNEYSPFRPHILELRSKLKEWGQKLTTKPPKFFTVLFLWGGTDILDNYPVIIGVERTSVQGTKGSRFVDLYEDRSEQMVSIANFTHIEVPENRVLEVIDLFKDEEWNMPVTPIMDSNFMYI